MNSRKNSYTIDGQVNGWAVLAEKDKYSEFGVSDLQVDYIPITQMRQVLEDAGWESDHICELREFDRETLIDGLDWLAENADKDDVVLLYAGAHGGYFDVLKWDTFFADAWKQIPSHRRILIIDA